MAWGSNTLSDKDFYKLMARFADVTNIKTVEKYWQAAVEVIIRELYVNHSCRVPQIGTFVAEELKENIQHHVDDNGKDVYYHVPYRILPKFIPHDNFINDINMMAVTKQARKRAKQGNTTERDRMRRLRAQSFDLMVDIKDQKALESKKEFKELLKQKSEDLAKKQALEGNE